MGKFRGTHAQAVKATTVPRRTFLPVFAPNNVVSSTLRPQKARRELSAGGARFREARQGLNEIRANKARVEEELENVRAAVQAIERRQDEAAQAERNQEAEVRKTHKNASTIQQSTW